MRSGAANLGASQIVEVNIRTGRVVRTIPGLAQVHGVLVIPALHRVYVTATGANTVVRIDEDTGRVLGKTATGVYPDGLPTTRRTARSGPPTNPAGQKPSSTPPPARPAGRCDWTETWATSPMTRSPAACWWTYKAATSSR